MRGPRTDDCLQVAATKPFADAKATRSPSIARPAANSKLPLPLPLIFSSIAGCASLGLVSLILWSKKQREVASRFRAKNGKEASGPGPCAKLKPSSRCVPLADGSACVIRRDIAADNSCLFNSIGYAMHKSKTRAPHLRNVVAQQVSGDKTTYSDVFLGMGNEAYCNWIRQPYTWGGGIELSILAQAYGIEIAAWNIESCKEHVFGEESGYKRQAMVIYNGVHYDALAVCSGPRANPEDDETTYNPRSKRGKMIIAASRKLVELAHKESQFHGASNKKTAAATGTSAPSSAQPKAIGTAAAGPAAQTGSNIAASAGSGGFRGRTSGNKEAAAGSSADAIPTDGTLSATTPARRKAARRIPRGELPGPGQAVPTNGSVASS